MKRRIFICLFLTIQLCTWLAGSGLAADVEQKDYFPVRVGIGWTMDIVLTPSKGEIIHGTGRRKITDTVQREGKTYCRSQTSIEIAGFPVQELSKLVRKDESGFYSIDEGEKDAVEQPEIPLPLVVGHTWEYLSNGKARKGTVVGFEDVTVNGVTYKNCCHLREEATDGSFKEDFWEVPKTGCVKSVGSYPGKGEMVLTLRRFNAGKE